MNEALEATLSRLQEGVKVALATLIAVEGSSPREPGAMMAVDDFGRISGSISSGCVEADVVERSERLLRVGGIEIVSYAASSSASFDVGLTCGGYLEAAIAIVPDRSAGGLGWCEAALEAGRGSKPVVIAFAASPAASAASPFVVDVSVQSHSGRCTVGIARELLLTGGTRLVGYGAERRFLKAYGVRPKMILFGAMDFSNAVAKIGKFLDYAVTLVDARERFATRERVPDADEIVVAWPDEYVQQHGIAPDTAVVILNHEEKFDVPLLAAALRSDAAYIGVMGSRSTHARRLEALRKLGFDQAQLSRLHAPIGLDIGARTPEEVAVSIASEILAVRASRGGGKLSECAPGNRRSAQTEGYALR